MIVPNLLLKPLVSLVGDIMARLMNSVPCLGGDFVSQEMEIET